MVWWVWVLLGFLLFGLELTATTLHLAFFGVGALVVGLVVALGYDGPLSTQLLMFTGVSVFLLLFRRPMLRLVHYTPEERKLDTLVGETAVAMEEIAPDTIGKAELRGSSWSARNIGERALARGERCEVTRVEGFTLCIKAH